MRNIGLQCAVAIATALLFVLALVLNEWIFGSLQFVRGVHWIYMPAGVRVLCTLLFAEAGAVGLLIVSLLACIYYFFPDDLMRGLLGGIKADDQLLRLAALRVLRITGIVGGVVLAAAGGKGQYHHGGKRHG